MIISIFLLAINLSLLKCALTEDQIENIQAETSENHACRDIFSRHLDERLFHKVLQYDAKSTGRMAKANRALKKLATDSRTFRYFEGAGWDMPELANICEFGVTDAINRPQLEAELARIMAFSHIKDEATFNQTLENLLFKDKVFKELAVPVLKYLIRARNKHLKDKDSAKRQKYLVFAVENRFYDIFFDLSKDPGVWNNKTLGEIIDDEIHDSFYFDCYNNYVFDNRIASKFMFNKITAIGPTDYSYFRSITPGGEKLSRSEAYAWAAVCIYRRIPEKDYAPYLSELPGTFLDIIEEYIYKYSPITFDVDEKDYFHGFINSLLDKYFGENENFKKGVEFTRFLNDVRFGYVNESVFEERIEQIHVYNYKLSRKLAMLMLAASKANNKKLVQKMAKHTEFNSNALESLVESKSPHSFKVCFDIMEDVPAIARDIGINFATAKVIKAVLLSSNNFKITKATLVRFGVIFEAQTPDDFVKLGFASKYDIGIWPYSSYVAIFMQKMV